MHPVMGNLIQAGAGRTASETLDEVQRASLEEIRRAGEELPGLVDAILSRRP